MVTEALLKHQTSTRICGITLEEKGSLFPRPFLQMLICTSSSTSAPSSFFFVTTPEDGGFPFGPVNKPTGPRSFLMDCNGPFGLVSFTMGRFFKTLGSSCDTIGQFNKTVFCVRSARWPPRSLPADCTCFCLFWSSVCKNLHNCPSLTHTTHTHSSCINFASYSSYSCQGAQCWGPLGENEHREKQRERERPLRQVVKTCHLASILLLDSGCTDQYKHHTGRRGSTG